MLDRAAQKIWMKAFWGFDPGNYGYVGFSSPVFREELLKHITQDDLVFIYGAVSAETEKHNRRQPLGFLQIDPVRIEADARMSEQGRINQRERGHESRWPHAVPVLRAWTVDKSQRVAIRHLVKESYGPKNARHVARCGVLLSEADRDSLLQLQVHEINVFGQPPVTADTPTFQMREHFTPSRAGPLAFGKRESNYEDGPSLVYLARFSGDAERLLGKPVARGQCLVKVGHTNNIERRLNELNSGFPPVAAWKWNTWKCSDLYNSATSAQAAETKIKAIFHSTYHSQEGEFFLVDEETVLSTFLMNVLSQTRVLRAV